MKELTKKKLIKRARKLERNYLRAVNKCTYANDFGIRFNNIVNILIEKHKYYLNY